jgi:hypothetical protein
VAVLVSQHRAFEYLIQFRHRIGFAGGLSVAQLKILRSRHADASRALAVSAMGEGLKELLPARPPDGAVYFIFHLKSHDFISSASAARSWAVSLPSRRPPATASAAATRTSIRRCRHSSKRSASR